MGEMRTGFKRAAMVLAGLCTFGMLQAGAVVLDLSSEWYLGFIDAGIPSSPANETSYINELIQLAPGTGPVTIGSQDYTRSLNEFTSLPTAVVDDAVKNDDAVNTGSFGSGYTYLIAKYDGPNYGSEVWNVSGLTGTFTLPQALGRPGDHRTFDISHWSLYNVNRVPDGGMTVAMLGFGILGLLALRKRLG